MFAALKLAQQEAGRVHIAADIGCHAFGTFEPFSLGHSILGYGMSLASRAGVSPMMQRRALAIMGDGGFWHNGLLTGVQSALFNGDDAVLLIFKNGYTSATGTQDIISTPDDEAQRARARQAQSVVDKNTTIERRWRGLGVQWLRTVHTYEVDEDARDARTRRFTSDFNGLKVIMAEGECQLERQRRIRPWIASLLKRGERVVRIKYGVDEDVCNGDHACIRLSGCPTLTIKDNPDPLKVDPVATVIDGCVGCGLCGANAHAATLCPSFYRAEVVQNPQWHERLLACVRGAVRRVLAAGMTMATNRTRPDHPAGLRPRRRRRRRARANGWSTWRTRAGYAAQSTSIPGVAQRTGATTYYIEFFPLPLSVARRAPAGVQPEPGARRARRDRLFRAAGDGAPGRQRHERAAAHAGDRLERRTLTTAERMQLGDGRAEARALLQLVRNASAASTMCSIWAPSRARPAPWSAR